MAGFATVTAYGEYYGQSIVNVFHYRSVDWLPLEGNPFDDVQAILDAVVGELQPTFLACMSNNYTLVRWTSVGYDDQLNAVTSTPLIHTSDAEGTLGTGDSAGAIICANILLRCGDQHQIKGSAKSKRNRGYLAIGPMTDPNYDAYGHVFGPFQDVLDAFAQHIDNHITVLLPPCTLIPIRFHRREGAMLPGGIGGFVTYSDVLGYQIPRKISARKSRLPEA